MQVKLQQRCNGAHKMERTAELSVLHPTPREAGAPLHALQRWEKKPGSRSPWVPLSDLLHSKPEGPVATSQLPSEGPCEGPCAGPSRWSGGTHPHPALALPVDAPACHRMCQTKSALGYVSGLPFKGTTKEKGASRHTRPRPQGVRSGATSYRGHLADSQEVNPSPSHALTRALIRMNKMHERT